MSCGVFCTAFFCFCFHLSLSLALSLEFYNSLKSLTNIPTSSKLRHHAWQCEKSMEKSKIVNYLIINYLKVHDPCLSETWPNVTGLTVWVVLQLPHLQQLCEAFSASRQHPMLTKLFCKFLKKKKRKQNLLQFLSYEENSCAISFQKMTGLA